MIESRSQRFIYVNGFLVDVIDQTLIRSFSKSSHPEIPCDIEILGRHVFQTASVSFASRFTRIESEAFSGCRLAVEMLSTVLFMAHDINHGYRLAIASGKRASLSISSEF
jgi:hypothetical protein